MARAKKVEPEATDPQDQVNDPEQSDVKQSSEDVQGNERVDNLNQEGKLTSQATYDAATRSSQQRQPVDPEDRLGLEDVSTPDNIDEAAKLVRDGVLSASSGGAMPQGMAEAMYHVSQTTTDNLGSLDTFETIKNPLLLGQHSTPVTDGGEAFLVEHVVPDNTTTGYTAYPGDDEFTPSEDTQDIDHEEA